MNLMFSTGALQTAFPAPDENVRKVRLEINTDANLKLSKKQLEKVEVLTKAKEFLPGPLKECQIDVP